MGGKQTSKGKHIYVLITGLVIFTLSACTVLKKERRIEIEETKDFKTEDKEIEKSEKEKLKEEFVRLRLANKLLSQGDYDGSLSENQKVLSLSGKNPPGDEALFNSGLIYSHYGNPRKDYKKSIEFFQKLLTDYPQSPLLEQAKIWIGILKVIEDLIKVDIEINQKKKELSR